MDEDLAEWITHVCNVLELPPNIADYEQLLLDVARDVAHNVMRPAAPLTTFLVGLAAAGQEDPGAAIERAATVVSALSVEWPNRPVR